MTARRTIVLGVVAWLVVVVVGATLVWSVISRAGEGVASTAQPDVSPATISQRSTPPEASASGPEPRQQPDNRRTWQGTAGFVTVACAGGAASVPNAGPNPGWAIEIEDAGPDEVRVDFDVGDGGGRVRVEAVCRNGAPVFEVDAD
jgi:hypothetical protein